MLATIFLTANAMALVAFLSLSILSLPIKVEARPGVTRHHKKVVIDRGAGLLARRGKTLCPQKRGETGDFFQPIFNSGNGALEIVNTPDGSSQSLFTAIVSSTTGSGRKPLSIPPIVPAGSTAPQTAAGPLFTPNVDPSPSSTTSSTSVVPASSTSSSTPVLATSSPSAVSTSSDSSSSGSSFSGPGLFGFSTPQCGASGATAKVSKLAGPNGSMDFLNCGLYSSGGWTPPPVNIGQLSAVSLDEAILDPNSPFVPCKPYVGLFDKYAAETGLPPILIAAIAMQESTCNPSVMGDNNGAYGLMQITQDKCTSGIDCSDPDYNVKTGTYYLKSRLDANNGNILKALGEYNGWYQSLTVAKATAIKSSCCQCQNNLNYLHQMLNGWMQNQIGYNLGDFDMGC